MNEDKLMQINLFMTSKDLKQVHIDISQMIIEKEFAFIRETEKISVLK